MSARKALLAAAIFLLFFSAVAYANNLTISNVKVVGWNATANTAQVQFDITWSNAWRDATNYDAAWLFIKYSIDSGVTWNHATLAHQGHTTSLDVEVILPSDYKGAFIQFSEATSSHTLTAETKIVWNYGADGLSDSAVASVATKVRVFGIEMVYIPQGSFYAGDTLSSAAFKGGSSDNNPWHITSEDAISVNSISSGGYYYQSNDNSGEDATGSTFAIPAVFPKGCGAFYLMKYEMSQKQYRDFLNTLTRAQQNNLTAAQTARYFTMSNNALAQFRNGIRNPSSIPGGAITFGCDFFNDDGVPDGSRDGEWIAMNYLGWMDLAAYADWAALRPVTELEYEKAARGTNTAVPVEYAWGNTTVETATISLANAGASSETPNQGNMNYSSSSPVGPYRVGSFADSSSTRQNAGAGYYGNLELSGNLWERVVTVGNASGRGFGGSHGDGVLSANGYATNADWPGYASGEVTSAAGSGFRGGSWQSSTNEARVSARSYAAEAAAQRDESSGGRLARAAE